MLPASRDHRRMIELFVAAWISLSIALIVGVCRGAASADEFIEGMQPDV